MQLDASVAAIVTGGASGLGAATARRLAGHGVKVALFDLNTELGERVAGEIGGSFCRTRGLVNNLQANVTSNFCVTPITDFADTILHNIFT